MRASLTAVRWAVSVLAPDERGRGNASAAMPQGLPGPTLVLWVVLAMPLGWRRSGAALLLLPLAPAA